MLKNLRSITETKISSATMPTKKAAISSMPSMKMSIALRGGTSCGSGIPETGVSATDIRRGPVTVTNPPLQGEGRREAAGGEVQELAAVLPHLPCFARRPPPSRAGESHMDLSLVLHWRAIWILRTTPEAKGESDGQI